jgi:hypothetical protein
MNKKDEEFLKSFWPISVEWNQEWDNFNKSDLIIFTTDGNAYVDDFECSLAKSMLNSIGVKT